MKKLFGTAAVALLIVAAPAASFAGKKHHGKHRDHAGEYIVGTGAGAAAGAVIAGPVGAVVGGAAGLVLVLIHDDHHHHR